MKLLKRMITIIVLTILLLVIVTFLFMQQASFGRLPGDIRITQFKKSKNYRDEVFSNIHETELLAKDASYPGMMIDFFFSKKVNREPVDSIPSVKTNLKSLPDKPLLVWFGHSSYFIHLDGKNILVDPVLSDRPSPVQYAGGGSYPGANVYTPEDFPNLDAIIISHDHYDHLDYNSIIRLKEKAKEFYVPLGVGEHLEKWGVSSLAIHEMDWWDSLPILDSMQLVATPARHFSGRGFSRNKTLWASYVLIAKDHKLFIGGDSGYDDSFLKIGEKYGPFDLVMLESGQYNVQWPNVHMMPEETVQASIDLKGKVLMPVHWGRFTLALHPWKEPIERVQQEATKKNVTITTPTVGEVMFLDGKYSTTAWWQSIN